MLYFITVMVSRNISVSTNCNHYINIQENGEIMQKGIVFNIQKFCVNDGPGIRTTVFLKGCQLNCLWCQNPESNRVFPVILYDAKKCIGCGRCAAVCEKGGHRFENGLHGFLRQECIGCGRCSDECVTDALELAGKEMTVEEVISDVMKDAVFNKNSGGGMTVSGGEPMLQFDFTYALLKAAKEKGLHTCIETCGFAEEEKYRKIAPLIDIFLFDYKLYDPELHLKYTGVSNELILSYLKLLDGMGGKTVLRCPIIPSVNDTDEHLSAIADMANSLSNIIEINIEPYHPLGSSKSELLGKEYKLGSLGFPEESEVTHWIEYISQKTDVAVKKA